MKLPGKKMIDDDIREAITKRMSLHPEDSFAIDKCWEEEIRILCKDIDLTIDFMENRCTGEEFAWLSEVFEEVQEQAQSERFIQCLLDAAKKYPEETGKYNILEFIDPLYESERSNPTEIMPRVYKLKFMFDWGSGVCLWSANKDAEDKFGDYPILTSALPVSRELKERLERLVEWHDEAFNWDDPACDLLWDDGQISKFLATAKKTYLRLCEELGEEYEVEFIEHM